MIVRTETASWQIDDIQATGFTCFLPIHQASPKYGSIIWPGSGAVVAALMCEELKKKAISGFSTGRMDFLQSLLLTQDELRLDLGKGVSFEDGQILGFS